MIRYFEEPANMSGCDNLVLWGDEVGVESSLSALGELRPVAIVAASNRPARVRLVSECAQSLKIPVYVQPFRRDVQEFQRFSEQIRCLSADIFLVNSFSMILEPEWLTWPRYGAFNVHAALLPEYRGANVLNWALANGESKTGVTLHRLEEGIDTGAILLQREVKIEFDDTAVTLRMKLAETAKNLIQEFAAMDRRALSRCILQDESRARHWPRRMPKDGEIDWSWPAERIYNLIRALVAPWPGAFFFDGKGQKVVLDKFVSLAEVRQLKQSFSKAA